VHKALALNGLTLAYISWAELRTIGGAAAQQSAAGDVRETRLSFEVMRESVKRWMLLVPTRNDAAPLLVAQRRR